VVTVLKTFNLILVALAIAGCLAVVVALSDPSIDGSWLLPAPGLATPSLRKWVEASPCFGKCQ
jgi:hypothetical protein